MSKYVLAAAAVTALAFTPGTDAVETAAVITAAPQPPQPLQKLKNDIDAKGEFQPQGWIIKAGKYIAQGAKSPVGVSGGSIKLASVPALTPQQGNELAVDSDHEAVQEPETSTELKVEETSPIQEDEEQRSSNSPISGGCYGCKNNSWEEKEDAPVVTFDNNAASAQGEAQTDSEARVPVRPSPIRSNPGRNHLPVDKDTDDEEQVAIIVVNPKNSRLGFTFPPWGKKPPPSGGNWNPGSSSSRDDPIIFLGKDDDAVAQQAAPENEEEEDISPLAAKAQLFSIRVGTPLKVDITDRDLAQITKSPIRIGGRPWPSNPSPPPPTPTPIPPPEQPKASVNRRLQAIRTQSVGTKAFDEEQVFPVRREAKFRTLRASALPHHAPSPQLLEEEQYDGLQHLVVKNSASPVRFSNHLGLASEDSLQSSGFRLAEEIRQKLTGSSPIRGSGGHIRLLDEDDELQLDIVKNTKSPVRGSSGISLATEDELQQKHVGLSPSPIRNGGRIGLASEDELQQKYAGTSRSPVRGGGRFGLASEHDQEQSELKYSPTIPSAGTSYVVINGRRVYRDQVPTMVADDAEQAGWSATTDYVVINGRRIYRTPTTMVADDEQLLQNAVRLQNKGLSGSFGRF